MARYLTSSDVNVALNDTIPFDIVSIPCNKGCVVPLATGVLTLKGGNSNKFARYEVKLQGNIAIPEGGAVTPIAAAITLNGVAIPDSWWTGASCPCSKWAERRSSEGIRWRTL